MGFTDDLRAFGASVTYDAADVIEAQQAEIARLTAERDEWKAEYKTEKKGLETYRTKNVILIRERDQALARAAEITSSATALAAAAAMEMRERAASSDLWLPLIQEQSEGEWTQKQIEQDADNFGAAVRALPIDPDAQKALDKLLPKAREDAIREMVMPVSFIGSWHKVTEWCEAEGEAVSAQTAWGEVKQAILTLLNEGGRDE